MDTIVQFAGATEQNVDEDVRPAATAFPEWRRTPPQNRIQFLAADEIQRLQLASRHLFHP